MPPRHAYWTIILEGQPTAFRAHTPDELLPTLNQLKARHPDAVMMWFARGRLWESQEQARAAWARRHQDRARRDRGWRPGGEHRDPRERFEVPRDEKRRRFAAKRRRDAQSPRGPEDRPRRPERPEPRRGPSGAGGRPAGKPGGPPSAWKKPEARGRGNRGRGPGQPGRGPDNRPAGGPFRGPRRTPGSGRNRGGGGSSR